MSAFAQALIATLLVGAISLISIIAALRQWSERLEIAALSFAAGVLLATAFLELLPEAVERSGGDVLTATLAAFSFFFALERLIHGLHTDQSEVSSHDHAHAGH